MKTVDFMQLTLKAYKYTRKTEVNYKAIKIFLKLYKFRCKIFVSARSLSVFVSWRKDYFYI